jgi:hypothetical protein
MSEQPTAAPTTRALREERMFLLSRYDSYAMAPAIYKILRDLEVELSWRQYRREERRTWNR